MMRQYELVERVRRYNPGTDEDMLNRAYVYAMKAHGSQKRASGDPYFSHPLEVAAILTDLKLDDATIVAALLHDTIEDTSATREEIDTIFGQEIGALVEGLTKIRKLDLVSKKAAQAENLRKLLLAISDDVRVLLVKLADRLHNMRTLGAMPQAKRARISEETLDIYAPLAGRMGMHDMREELEALCFHNLWPEQAQIVTQRLDTLHEKNKGLIADIESSLEKRLSERGLTAVVKGRAKRPYSIWLKMERKSLGFEQLSDIYGFRLIVESIEDCYAALGVVHSTWAMVPNRFKDYISTPKQNGYSSIHTTVIGPGRQRVELQIRTAQMHQIAEYGIAAHAFYKDSAEIQAMRTSETGVFSWLRRTIELLAEGSSPEEFLEHTKLELFHDQVFCFSPKGKLIALPRHATAIDFAYAVHTAIGDKAVGCKINGQISPLASELANGDEVDILISETATPPAAWEQVVVTGKARAAIRRATRTAIRTQYAGLGRRIVERTFQAAGRNYSEESVKAVLSRLALPSIEDVFSAVGRGEMRAFDVIRAVYPDYKEERAKSVSAKKVGPGWFAMAKAASLKFMIPGKSTPAGLPVIPIRGYNSELPVRFAPDGGAVPGDRIVGILEPGKGITIYPIQSPALKAFDDKPDLWLDVQWDIEARDATRYPARLKLTSLNQPGSLAQITQVIAEHDGNINAISMDRPTPDFTHMTIDLDVWDLKHLMSIIAQLKTKPVVSAVERVNG